MGDLGGLVQGKAVLASWGQWLGHSQGVSGGPPRGLLQGVGCSVCWPYRRKVLQPARKQVWPQPHLLILFKRSI